MKIVLCLLVVAVFIVRLNHPVDEAVVKDLRTSWKRGYIVGVGQCINKIGAWNEKMAIEWLNSKKDFIDLHFDMGGGDGPGLHSADKTTINEGRD